MVLEQLRCELDALEQQAGGNYEISIATAGSEEKLANLNLVAVDPYVDFYNVMTSDSNGGWENQTGHQAMTGDANNYDVTSAVSVFEEAGVELHRWFGCSCQYPCMGWCDGWWNLWLSTIRHCG